MRRQLQDARFVLTGASSGIGEALAVALSEAGARLLLTARREERLHELAGRLRQRGGKCDVVAGDITDAQHREAMVTFVEQRFQGQLDGLINNAGIGALGPFAEASSERLRQVMEVNFFAPVELTRCLLPMLRQGRDPIVVNISSVLGHRAVPGKSEYCASKFAIHGISDSLRAEWQKAGVDVLLVSPSTTSSEFFSNVIEQHPDSPKQQARAMSPATVARHTLKAIRKGKHEVILSAGGKFLVWIDRLCPPLADRLVARYG